MKISSLQWSNKKISDYWDKRAKEVGPIANAPTTQLYKRSEQRLFKKFFGNIASKKLLKLDLWNEVNNTKILFWAARENAKVYGLDISPYLVNKTRSLFTNKDLDGTFVVSDMRKIKYPSNFFDFIYTMGTIEHVPDYDKAISEIYRVLKPGGIAIIGVPNKFDPFLRPFMVWVATLLNKYPYAPEKSFTFEELEKEVRKAGFKVLHKTGVLFIPGFIRMADVVLFKKVPLASKFFGLISRPFEYLENASEIFARSGYLIACVCKK